MKKLLFVLGLSMWLAACGDEVKPTAQLTKEDNAAAVSETKTDAKETTEQTAVSDEKSAVKKQEISKTDSLEKSVQKETVAPAPKPSQLPQKMVQRNHAQNNNIDNDELSAEERRVGVQPKSTLINPNNDECYGAELSEEERRIYQCR